MITKNEEVFDIKGDSKQGLELNYQMDANKVEVPVRWRDRLMHVDVYEMPEHLMLHLFCPKCQQALSVSSHKKRIRYNRSERRLHVERIGCTYPGCDWSAYFEGNYAKS